MKFFAAMIAGGLLSACAYLGSQAPPATQQAAVTSQVSPSASQTEPTLLPTTSAATSPSPSQAVSGCEPAAIAPFAPPWKGFKGFGALTVPILSTGSVVSLNDGLAALPDLMLPKVVPGDLSVRTIIVGNDPVKVGVGVFYSVRPIAQNEDWDAFFLDGRAIAVGEEPSRRNPAADVQAAWGDQALIVRVGNNDAALVAGQGHPTYDLSWSDGTLDFYGHASFTVSPSELVDLARSFYCP